MAPLGYHEGKALNRERDTFNLWNAYFCRLLAKQGNRIPAATLRNVVNHGFGQNLEFGLMELDATGAHHTSSHWCLWRSAVSRSDLASNSNQRLNNNNQHNQRISRDSRGCLDPPHRSLRDLRLEAATVRYRYR